MAVDARRRPARGLEAFHLIDAVGERQRSVNRNAVVVEQDDELFQLQVSGECNRFLTDALHQVAVGREHVGRVIDDVIAEHCREMALCNRHPHRIGNSLAERTGRGLDAWRVAVFRMTGCQRTKLTEVLEFFDRDLLVADEMQQRVEQHRAVAGREHEAVAVRPGGIGRIEFQEARKQHGRDVGRAHRQAGMAGLCLLDRIHRERPDSVRHRGVFGASGSARARGGKAGCLGEGCARREKTVRHRP